MGLAISKLCEALKVREVCAQVEVLVRRSRII
jgi:hypothetical protein